MMKIAVFQRWVSGSSTIRRKHTSRSPVADHEGLKSMCPVVRGLPSGAPGAPTKQDTAEAHGFDSLAVTDHGALYGQAAFYQAAIAKGIKPIIGVETYVARRSMRDKEGKADAQPFHLVLLATDMQGYLNLCRLITDAHVDGYYYKPRIDREHLARHSAGLVGLSACLGGEIPRALETDDWESARRLAGAYSEIFGPGRFFLEIQDHGLAEQRRLNEQLLRLAPETGLPLVVTNDLHYVHQSQAEAHDVLLCVGTGNNLDTPNRMKFETNDFWLKPAAEMERLFPEQREALLNTKRIAEMVDLSLPLGQLRIPHFPVPAGETVETWLRKECEAGLVRRYGAITPELQARYGTVSGTPPRLDLAAEAALAARQVALAQAKRERDRNSGLGSLVSREQQEQARTRVEENTAALEANLLSGNLDYVLGELGLSLDQALEFISEDEAVEVTPVSVRLRKVELSAQKRQTSASRKARGLSSV